jgi:hypothetical protein
MSRPKFDCALYLKLRDGTRHVLFNCATRIDAGAWAVTNRGLLDAGNTYEIGDAVTF